MERYEKYRVGGTGLWATRAEALEAADDYSECCRRRRQRRR